MADPFHQAAITGDHPGVMINGVSAELLAQETFRNSHTDSICEALPEWASSHLNPRGVTCLRMARCRRAPLAKGAEIVCRERSPAQVQHCVLQNRCVSCRKDETITVDPTWVCRVVSHDTAVQHVRKG